MRAVTMHDNGHNIFEVEAKVEDIVLAHKYKEPYLVITWEHMKRYYQCFNFPLTLSDRDTPIPVVPVD